MSEQAPTIEFIDEFIASLPKSQNMPTEQVLNFALDLRTMLDKDV